MQKTKNVLLFMVSLAAIYASQALGQFQVYSQPYGSRQTPPLYSLGYKFKGSQIVANGVFSDKTVPSFAQLQRDQHRFSNYIEFVDYLFSTAPALRQQFVLLHQSASLQIASKTHPRILVFGGGKVFTFSEHPDNKKLRVEMMEIDSNTRDINLREIIFGENGAQFDPNPKSCVACHGSPAKPVWDPYDFWPNAFGSLSGSAPGRDEIRAYKNLVDKKSHSPVLEQLIFPSEPNLTDEQINPLTYVLSQAHFYNWWKRKLAPFPQQSDLNGFRYALLSTLNLCQYQSTRNGFAHEKAKVLELFTKSAIPQEAKDRLDLIFSTIENDRRKFKTFLESSYDNLFPHHDVDFSFSRTRLDSESQALALTYWILDLAGIDTSDLPMSLVKNNYLVSMPTNFPLDLLTVLYDVRPDLFYDLEVTSQDLATGHSGWIKLNCEQLRTLARGQTTDFSAPTQWLQPNRIRTSQPPINRCAKCHVEGADPLAPAIPFHDSQLMARQLRNTHLGKAILSRIHDEGKNQMPPRHPLSRTEKEAVSAYIEALSY